MRVQGINNQNSISHKAYFKPNAEFKRLWTIRPIKDDGFFNKLKNFKSELPNHELEIIEINRFIIDKKVSDTYLIFNNVTHKSFGVAIALTNVKNNLELILESLLSGNDKTKDFFKSTEDTLKFEEITTKKI